MVKSCLLAVLIGSPVPGSILTTAGSVAGGWEAEASCSGSAIATVELGSAEIAEAGVAEAPGSGSAAAAEEPGSAEIAGAEAVEAVGLGVLDIGMLELSAFFLTVLEVPGVGLVLSEDD